MIDILLALSEPDTERQCSLHQYLSEPICKNPRLLHTPHNKSYHNTMPPAKKVVPPEDSRSDASTVRERQIAAAAHARKSKQNAAAAAASARDNGSLALKELAAVSAETGGREGPGVSREENLQSACAYA